MEALVVLELLFFLSLGSGYGKVVFCKRWWHVSSLEIYTFEGSVTLRVQTPP